jgi:hypothetical protein
MNSGLPLTSAKALYSGPPWVALAAGAGGGLFVEAGVVEVLVVDEAERAGAHALHVPDVADFTILRRHAALLVEAGDGVVDVPDHRPLVLVVDVVVATLVLRILQLLPRAVGLLLERAAAHRLGRVVALHEEIGHVAGVDGLQGGRGLAGAAEVGAFLQRDLDRLCGGRVVGIASSTGGVAT